jgi:EXS family
MGSDSRTSWTQSRSIEQEEFPWKFVGFGVTWCLCFYVLFFESSALKQSPQNALFIFYQPMAHILAMLWLWNIVVAFFESYAIRYDACFAQEHLRFLLSAKALTDVAAAFTTVTAVSAAIFVACCARGEYEIAGYQPVLMYGVLLMMLMNPLDLENETTFGQQRWFFVRTLRRVFVPVQVRI